MRTERQYDERMLCTAVHNRAEVEVWDKTVCAGKEIDFGLQGLDGGVWGDISGVLLLSSSALVRFVVERHGPGWESLPEACRGLWHVAAVHDHDEFRACARARVIDAPDIKVAAVDASFNGQGGA